MSHQMLHHLLFKELNFMEELTQSNLNYVMIIVQVAMNMAFQMMTKNACHA
jgi:hypothetical protein